MLIKHIKQDYLPRSIKELIAVIGHKATDIIIKEYGGIRLCVPQKISHDHWLFEAISSTAFKKLVEHYNGEEIEIPNCKRAMHHALVLNIAAEKANGASTYKLAKKYGLTARRIRMIQQEQREQKPNPQTSLF